MSGGHVKNIDRSILHDLDHRPPILCLDQILHNDSTSARCRHTVVAGPHVHDGVMWEAGLIEGMAQTTALLKGRAAREAGIPVQVGMLVGLKNLAFHRQPTVGEVVTFEVEIIRSLEPMTLVKCATRCGDELLAEGEMKFFLQPMGDPPAALSDSAE